MSTGTLTFSIDQANEYIGVMDRKNYVDGKFLNLGAMNAYRKHYGQKLGEMWTGPEVVSIPMAVRVHSSSTGFQNGAQTINLATQSTDEHIQFRQGNVVRPITVNVAELTACGTQDAVNRFLADRVKNVRLDAEREYNRHQVAGGVAAYELSGTLPWNSFNGIDHSTYGFFEDRAFGSQTNTIGGFSKATYAATAKQTQNIFADVNGAFSTNGMTQVFAGITKLNKYSMYKDGRAILCTEAFQNNLKRALAPQERFMSEKTLDGGWRPATFAGMDLYIEEYMPVSTTYGGSASATNPMSALLFNANTVWPVWSPAIKVDDMTLPDGKFGLGTFRRLPEQYAWASEIRIAGGTKIKSWADAMVVIDAEVW